MVELKMLSIVIKRALWNLSRTDSRGIQHHYADVTAYLAGNGLLAEVVGIIWVGAS